MPLLDHHDSVQPAPSWRCPECRTLQPESIRCWRCDAPAFSCRTCHRYRPSIARDLGYCADDAARTPLLADETRSCWEPAGLPVLGVITGVLPDADQGLFADVDIAPSYGQPTARPAAPGLRGPVQDPHRSTPKVEARKPKPPLEAPGRAAWAEPESDALVEAPHVHPGKRLSTEVQRRRRRWSR